MTDDLTEYIFKWADAGPDKTAVIDWDSALSYKELAGAIREKAGEILPCRPNDDNRPIIIEEPKSVSTLVTMLAINYSGHSYCVLDDRLPEGKKNELHDILHCGGSFPPDLKYITFSSGSTGRPKLIMTSRTAAMNYLASLTAALPYNKDLVIANQSPFCFDACLKDAFAALFVGATVYLTDRRLFTNPEALISVLSANKVNALTWTSSAYGVLYSLLGGDLISDRDFCENVKLITFGSERMSPDVLRWLIRNFPAADIYQLYGPTEATGMSTYFKVDKELSCLLDDGLIPIGRPLPGVNIILMNDGIESDKEGEIYINSNRLSDGYYGDKALTDRSFINIDGKRYFKTGDIAKTDKGGNLLFLGRNDDIIKRGGYQISLNAMSAFVEKYDGVDKAIALFYEEKNKLMLFYVGTADKGKIRDYLSEHFPTPAVPGRIIRLDTFPLLSNGKTDRKALLAWKN